MPTMPTKRRFLAVATICAVALVPASVAAPAAGPSLKITPLTLDFGKGDVVLSGVLPSKRAGEKVSILSQPCLFTEAAEIASVTTKAGGAFRFRVQPMLNTRFRVRWNQSLSGFVKVGVRPLIELERAAVGRYEVQIKTTNPVFLNGKLVELQRAVGDRWVTLKRAKLVKASPETAITVLSATTIRAKTTGVLRVKLPASQAGCYLSTTSNTIAA